MHVGENTRILLVMSIRFVKANALTQMIKHQRFPSHIAILKNVSVDLSNNDDEPYSVTQSDFLG